jgi:hypothetical protein
MSETHPTLVKMLERYDLTSAQSSFDALREILQEIVLLGLYEGGFFKHAVFYGDTALRILHGLPRFSEDLDFSLLAPDPQFDLKPYEKAVVEALGAFGFEVSIEIKEKTARTPIHSAFVKGNTVQHLMRINAPRSIVEKIHRDQAVKIKLEVDTEPPGGFSTENIVRLTPRPFSVTAMTLPSLYAGKMHALLCRSWTSRPKGRDWYDLVWYIAHDATLDLGHLEARLHQSCKWAESSKIPLPETLDGAAIAELLERRIEKLDIAKAKQDVRPFIKNASELDLWSREFFMEIIKRIRVS